MEEARVVCCLLALLLCLPLAQCGHTLLNAHIARQGDSMNLTELINQRSLGDDILPTHVTELLQNLSNKPACHKMATHQLIISCQSIREDATNPRPSVEILEATKSIFAARLAICELQEASANTPSQCKRLLSISTDFYDGYGRSPSQLSSYTSEQISSADLRACLRALEAKPQSWTSYSNSRQHAALICDASRTEIVKEEALNLFHLLTNFGFEISQALADALQRANSQQEAEMAFAEALKDLHMEQLQDLVKAHQENKAVIKESGNQFTKAVHHVSDTVRSAIVSATDMKQMVEAVFLSAATGGAELASIRLRDAEANHEAALALREMVQGVASNDFAVLRGNLRETIDMAHYTGNVLQVVQQGSFALQEVVQGTSITVKQAAQEVRFLQDSTLAAARNIQVSNALAEGILQTITETKQNFGQLKELFELLAMISYTIQAIISKGGAIFVAVSTFMGASVASISCCFGFRYGSYLIVGYLQAFAVVLVIYSVPFHDWTAIALSNPFAMLSFLGMIAITGLIFNKNLRHKLISVLRLRRRSQSTPLPRAKLPGAMRWVPIPATEVSSLSQRSHRQELHRSRRAQTTPPRL